MLEIFHVETPTFFSFTPPYTPWGRLGARARLAGLFSGRGGGQTSDAYFLITVAGKGLTRDMIEILCLKSLKRPVHLLWDLESNIDHCRTDYVEH